MLSSTSFTACLILALFITPAPPAAAGGSGPIIIDHTCTVLEEIPEAWIVTAKDELRLCYGHSSHGSQPVTGMRVLMDDPTHEGLYDFNYDGDVEPGILSLEDSTPSGDLGNPDYTTWASRTRSHLDGSGSDRNVVIWSWCGQADTTAENIDIYFGLMDQLETDYSDVTFVYMTGHLNVTGEEGNLFQRNNQIRDFCLTNGKVLFDFADIESYDPDGDYFRDLYATDSCNYSGGNWADEWCADNPGSPLCYDCECAHSRPLNCNLKGRAFWWMLARIAGWQAEPDQYSIAFSPASLGFTALQGGSAPGAQTLEIWCEGNGTLEWTAAETAGWLALSPASGSSTGEHDPVTVEVDAAGMQNGTYNTAITITAPGAENTPQSVPVSLTVTSTDTFIAAGPGPGYGNLPEVRVFPPEQGSGPIYTFAAYGAPHYGVNVSSGRVNGGTADVILTGAGPGDIYGPHVRGFLADGTPVGGLSFLAYGTNKWGVNVAAGDLDGDGYDEIITAPGPSGVFGAHIRGWNVDGSVSPMPGLSFFAWPTTQSTFGARVFAGSDLDGDGRDDLVTGAGPDPRAGTPVNVYRYLDGTASLWFSLDAFPAGTTMGASVAAGRLE